jgi:hypothetical protein
VLPEQVFVLPTKEENMQIRYLSGPRKDTTEHVARTTTIQQLLNAGLIEEIAPPPPAPPKVSWGVHRGRETDRPAIVGRCNREVCGTVRFEGKPEDAHITIFTHSCSATPPEKAPAGNPKPERSAYDPFRLVRRTTGALSRTRHISEHIRTSSHGARPWMECRCLADDTIVACQLERARIVHKVGLRGWRPTATL